MQHGFPLGWVEVVEELMGIHYPTHAGTCHVGGQHPRIDRVIEPIVPRTRPVAPGAGWLRRRPGGEEGRQIGLTHGQ